MSKVVGELISNLLERVRTLWKTFETLPWLPAYGDKDRSLGPG